MKRRSVKLDPTTYSESKISYYKEHIMDGEALQDLERIQEFGISTKYPVDYVIWRVLEKWIAYNPKDGYTVKEIEQLIYKNVFSRPEEIKFELNNTSLHHHLNGYVFPGCLHRKEVHGVKTYYIEKEVLKRGLDWFKNGNKYVRGNFQNVGLFKLI